MDKIRLPKQVEEDQAYPMIVELLSQQKKIWSGGRLKVPTLSFNLNFVRSLQLEHRRGRLVRGFDLIERNLENQARGMQQVDEKSGQVRGQRISRLIVFSNDGADRYLRKVENLLEEHRGRVLGIMIDMDSEKLGQLFFGEGKSVKMLMVEHKESVSAVLLAMTKNEHIDPPQKGEKE
ncbi:MAG: hypothetical protein ACOYXC_11110 [Candidatus Rifleibacteriota bacterium]